MKKVLRNPLLLGLIIICFVAIGLAVVWPSYNKAHSNKQSFCRESLSSLEVFNKNFQNSSDASYDKRELLLESWSSSVNSLRAKYPDMSNSEIAFALTDYRPTVGTESDGSQNFEELRSTLERCAT